MASADFGRPVGLPSEERYGYDPSQMHSFVSDTSVDSAAGQKPPIGRPPGPVPGGPERGGKTAPKTFKEFLEADMTLPWCSKGAWCDKNVAKSLAVAFLVGVALGGISLRMQRS